MTPTVGLQTLEVILFALVTRRLFYFNRAAALALIHVSNPFTMAAIYYGLYWAGSCFVPGDATLQRFQQILTFEGFSGWWHALSELATDIGLPLVVGTIVVAPVSATATYPLTRILLRWYRGDNPPGNDQSTEKQSSHTELSSSPDPNILKSAQAEALRLLPLVEAPQSACTAD